MSKTSPLVATFAALACSVLCASPAAASEAQRIRLTGAERPPILDLLTLPESLQALAVTADGRRAALATSVVAGRRSQTSEIRVHGMDGSVVVVPIDGLVRDLLFLEIDGTLLAVRHRPARRHEGETSLVVVDLESRKAVARSQLPSAARSIEYWPSGGSLLIPVRNELRTLTLPRFHGGPLFRIPGENRSLAVIDGSRLLVGQDSALLLVDLADPQGRESLPIRERIVSPSPVVSISVGQPDGRLLAGWADGRIADISLDPLSMRARGADIDVEPAVESPPVEAARATVPEPSAATFAQLRGRIEGADRDRVEAVVLLGPDNLLREAARIPPDADGRYSASGLAPGHYRVQLDGGGSRALVTRPAFHQVLIAPDVSVEADFQVVRAF